jgi:hypothetical protein
VLDALTSGRITLTTIRLLAPHLTDDNHRELIDAAEHKSKRDVELLIATINPKPPVPTTIRRVSQPAAREKATTSTSALMPTAPPNPLQPRVDAEPTAARRGALSVLSVDSYKLQVTISRDTHEKLRRAEDLFRHANPSGDLATLLDRAVTLLLADLERRRCAATPAPRGHPAGSGTGRYIPAGVRREVWRRDQGRCAFVGTSGRCHETAFLEFHHVEPFAEGGKATVENIQVRCKAHNRYEASLFFGEGADCVRESAMGLGVASLATRNSFQDELNDSPA